MGITHLCENAHFDTKSFNIPVSFALATLDHMTKFILCMRYVAIQQTIRYSICKISVIACGPPFWTVFVSWYPHHMYITMTTRAILSKINIVFIKCNQLIPCIASNRSLYMYDVQLGMLLEATWPC